LREREGEREREGRGQGEKKPEKTALEKYLLCYPLMDEKCSVHQVAGSVNGVRAIQVLIGPD